jgi:hypothetical protein
MIVAFHFDSRASQQPMKRLDNTLIVAEAVFVPADHR